jgi:PAS domain S-box-containing protein
LKRLEFSSILKASLDSRRGESKDPGKYYECWSILSDITEKQKLVERIEENSRRFNALFQSSLNMIMVIDDTGRYIEVNKMACRRLGYSRKELLNLSLYDLTAPEMRNSIEGFWKDFESNGAMKGEYSLVCKDGHVMDVEFSAVYNFVEGKHLSILSDITEKKKREKKIMEQSDQLKLINDILRHDLKNYFGSIRTALQLMEKGPRKDLMEIVVKNSEKGLDLINRMKDTGSMVSSDDNGLDTLDMEVLVNTLRESHSGVEIETDISCDIRGDRAFSPLLDNLVSNAKKHGGADRISIRSFESDGFCRVEVSDNGKGVPDEIKDRIFEESFKYGDTGQTGVGLYIVDKIVERFGGHVWVEDNEYGGANFIMEFPIVE